MAIHSMATSTSQGAHKLVEPDAEGTGDLTIAKDGDMFIQVVGNGNKDGLRLRVSRESLTQRSKYFEARLGSGRLSKRPSSSNCPSPAWDPLVVHEEGHIRGFLLFMLIVHDRAPDADSESIASITLQDLRHLAVATYKYQYRGKLMPEYIARNLAKRIEEAEDQDETGVGSSSDSLPDCMIVAHVLNLQDEFDKASRHVLWNQAPNTLLTQVSPELLHFLPPNFVNHYVAEIYSQGITHSRRLCDAFHQRLLLQRTPSSRRRRAYEETTAGSSSLGAAPAPASTYDWEDYKSWVTIQLASYKPFDVGEYPDKALRCFMEDMLVDWIDYMVGLGRYDPLDAAAVDLDEVVSMRLPEVGGYFCFGSGYMMTFHQGIRRITRQPSLSHFQRATM